MSETGGKIKKRLLTGLQPSGTLHIGNYFGALKPFVDTYEEYESFLMVADLHALTTLRDPKELRGNIINIVKDYLAAGVNPKKAVVFQQSQIPEHTELAWMLECLVTVPFLMQAHSYKDKTAKGLEPNVGLFTYPMLMAADILLYDTDVVPVGEDQRQHIEYSREAATKFNNAYGETLKLPKEIILKSVATVPGTDGQKMSKSYKNTIPLFGSRDELQKTVMGIVTDSDGERPENVYQIHTLFRDSASLDALYEEHKGKYKNLKEALLEDIDAFIAPMRARRESITDEDVTRILNESSDRAREEAKKKIIEMKYAAGVML